MNHGKETHHLMEIFKATLNLTDSQDNFVKIVNNIFFMTLAILTNAKQII